MEIDINQKKISIGDKYRVFIEGQQTHIASTKLFRWLAEINLFETGSSQPRYAIKKKWTWFKASYDITSWDYNLFEFRTKNIWKRHYYCQAGKDLYEIYGHRGRKYSVYKNDTQVAWWDQQTVTWFEGDNYKMIAEKGPDFELLISFCLVMDNHSSNSNNGNLFTINLGNVGPQARPFDPGWQPAI